MFRKFVSTFPLISFDPESAVDAPPSAAPTGPGAAGGTGEGSPPSQPGAEVPPSVSPPSDPGSSAEPRMYTSEEMSNAVRDRLAKEQEKYAPYKDLGSPDEIRERLGRADRLEKAMRGDTPAQPSQDERDLQELMKKQFPGIEKGQDFEDRISAMEATANANRANVGKEIISSFAKEKLGVADAKAVSLIEGAVSASIAADPESLKSWLAGDMGVVNKHLENVFTNSFEPLLKSAAARYSGGKAGDIAEVPPTVPKGGVQAPVSQEKKLTSDERKEAAWKSFQAAEGRG